MAELLLIARLGGRRIAFPAKEVEAVVELDDVTPVPGAPPHIAGLSALRSRVLTVVDTYPTLGLAKRDGLTEALVVPSAGHAYALLVEEVEDVVEREEDATALKVPPGPGWDRITLGMVGAKGDLVLLVDPHLLIAGAPALAA